MMPQCSSRGTSEGWGQFKLGKQLVDFTTEDVTVIFGIECGDQMMNLVGHAKMPESEFVERRFRPGTRINASDLKYEIESAIKQ